MRFTTLLVSTLTATQLLTFALAQQLPQLDAVLPGHRIVINSSGVAFEYADRTHLTTAAAGDSGLIFVTEPLDQRIAVLDRFTGSEVGQVPAPLGGFLLPFFFDTRTKPGAIGGTRFRGFSEPSGAFDCARL
jgi:hypothetical protein